MQPLSQIHRRELLTCGDALIEAPRRRPIAIDALASGCRILQGGGRCAHPRASPQPRRLGGGAAAAEHAWVESHSMTLDQALDYAMSHAPGTTHPRSKPCLADQNHMVLRCSGESSEGLVRSSAARWMPEPVPSVSDGGTGIVTFVQLTCARNEWLQRVLGESRACAEQAVDPQAIPGRRPKCRADSERASRRAAHRPDQAPATARRTQWRRPPLPEIRRGACLTGSPGARTSQTRPAVTVAAAIVRTTKPARPCTIPRPGRRRRSRPKRISPWTLFLAASASARPTMPNGEIRLRATAR